MEFLILGIDSFIACMALGPLVSRRSWLPLALLFGLADGVGALAGGFFHVQIADAMSDALTSGILALLGLYLLVVALAFNKVSQAATRWPVWATWLVPWVLTIDNMTYHLAGTQTAGSLFWQAFGQEAWSSALLALIGLVVGAVITRAIPALQCRAIAIGTSGSALIATAGLLLLLA